MIIRETTRTLTKTTRAREMSLPAYIIEDYEFNFMLDVSGLEYRIRKLDHRQDVYLVLFFLFSVNDEERFDGLKEDIILFRERVEQEI